MRGTERAMLTGEIVRLEAAVGELEELLAAAARAAAENLKAGQFERIRMEAELGATRATATALAEECQRLRERIDLAIGKAHPIPSAEPGEGSVGVAIYLDGREWDFMRGSTR